MAGCPPPTPSPNRRAGPAGFSSWHLRAPARAPRFALPPARPPGTRPAPAPPRRRPPGQRNFPQLRLEASAPAGVRQQKGGRRAAPPAPAPAPRKLAPGAPAAGGAAAAAVGTPRGRGGQALTAASGPDLPCRAAIVRRPRGNPSPRAAPLPRYLLGGARSASKFPGIGLKIPAPAARRGPAGLRPPGPRPRPARQLLEGSLHCVPHPRVCWASSREAGSGDEAPAAEPRGAGAGRLRRARWPSGRGGRPAGGRVLRLLGGRHPRPMEVRRSQLHGVAALPPASPAARVNGPRGRRGRPG